MDCLIHRVASRCYENPFMSEGMWQQCDRLDECVEEDRYVPSSRREV
jgi:hypothetical protein